MENTTNIMSLKQSIDESTSWYKGIAKNASVDEVGEAITKNKQKLIANYFSQIVELTNSTSHSAEEIAEGIYKGITNEHRFLQGEFWVVMEKVIAKYQDAPCDPRNEFATDMCKAMIKGNNERLDG